MRKIVLMMALALVAMGAFSQDITLAKPPTKLGVDVLDAIRGRTAARTFVKKDVPLSALSLIVWAGNGLKGTPDAVSAASKAGGTFPVSGDVNYVNLYVLDSKGVYRFDPAAGVLRQVSAKDARSEVTSENIPGAALMVLFTYDATRLPSFVKGNPAAGREMAIGTASYGAQNIGLVAGSLKLGSIIMYNVAAAATAQAAQLSNDETPLFIMQIGYTQ